MEQIRRRRLERKQYRMLRALCNHLKQKSPHVLDDTELGALGVVRWSDLDVDGWSPLDFEPRFFSPCLKEDIGLEEMVEERIRGWRSIINDPKNLLDPEWIPTTGWPAVDMRASFFFNVLTSLAMEYEDEVHPMYVVSPRSPFPRDFC